MKKRDPAFAVASLLGVLACYAQAGADEDPSDLVGEHRLPTRTTSAECRSVDDSHGPALGAGEEIIGVVARGVVCAAEEGTSFPRRMPLVASDR